jgi:DNA adenine methylase
MGFASSYFLKWAGFFNTPYGAPRRDPFPPLKRTIRIAAAGLQGAVLQTGDFTAVLDHAAAGDLIYLDPPYAPTSATAGLTTYTGDGFTWDDQVRVRDIIRSLIARRCAVLVSNAATPDSLALYQSIAELEIATVPASRAINCRPDRRRAGAELLAHYHPPGI